MSTMFKIAASISQLVSIWLIFEGRYDLASIAIGNSCLMAISAVRA